MIGVEQGVKLLSLDFTNLFVRLPGNMFYFLAIIAISQAGLLMALGQRLRRRDNRSAGRYLLASIGVVLAWGVLMIGALFSLVTRQDAATIIPPLERAASAITILLLGWAFLTADHDRWGRLPNVILLLLLLIVIVGYIFTGIQWPPMADQVDFNVSVFGATWTLVPLALSLLGLILTLVYVRVVADAPLKLVFFVILLVGYGITLSQIARQNIVGDYAGPARLAFIAALPVLPALIYRTIVDYLENEIATKARQFPTTQTLAATRPQPMAENLPEAVVVVSPIERESVQLLKTLGLMLEDAAPGKIPERVVAAATEVLKADIGVLFKLQDANYADVIHGFDDAMNRPIAGMALNLDNQPTLVNAIERRAQRPLYPDRNVEELQDLYTRLDINVSGPTYFQPLTRGKELVAVLAIGMPYTGRELTDAERELLKGIAIIAGNLLALSFAANEAQMRAEERAIEAMLKGVPIDEIEDNSVLAARQEMQASLEFARGQITELTRQVMQLKIELDYERQRMTAALSDTQEGQSISQRIIALNDEQQHLRDERDRLANRLQEAEAALVGMTTPGDNSMLQAMIEGLTREKDDLVSQRNNLQAQLADARATANSPIGEAIQDILERMSQEKARLEVEREQLNGRLVDIEAQLRALGIENGPAGLAQLIAQLHEQRASLQARSDAFKRERDALLNERAQLEENIRQEKERETLIQALQTEVNNLAGDREALTKQRDKLRSERDEIQAKLDVIKQDRARRLAEAAGYEIELAEAHVEQAKLRARIQELADERSSFVNQRDKLMAERQALETERDQLLARFEGDRERLQQLGADGIGSFTRMIEELSQRRDDLERELNDREASLADVQNQLERLQVRLEAQEKNNYQPENPEMLLGLVQEIRTPVTSIVGYLDLLLQESRAGILGEMQRRFLQRIAANVTRMTSMLDDLIQVTRIDTGQFKLSPQSVDVIELIEDAITRSSSQFREKGLGVNLYLEDDLPPVEVDPNAVNQIIGQLLTNAYLVSPPGSEISITARRRMMRVLQSDGEPFSVDSLFVSVEDQGGGIAPEDQTRVFTRKYRAENPLIAGLGDTGVGLSIAKTLVEAQGGNLWLETREGVGSAFNFTLPFMPVAEVEG
jgi:signal transduction histidine kinase